MQKDFLYSDTVDALRSELFSLQDEKYKEFSAKLTPSLSKDTVIGVRMPLLRSLAAKLINSGEANIFLGNLPHKYLEENNLHALILSKTADFDECVTLVDTFLPFVDNWATCDSLRPKCFAKNTDKLLPFIMRWISADDEYTVRFAIECLMIYYLTDDFDVSFLSLVASVKREEYYIKMMVAWYFATALALRWDDTLPYIANRCLGSWIHSKAIQKACESYRISETQKQELKKYRQK